MAERQASFYPSFDVPPIPIQTLDDELDAALVRIMEEGGTVGEFFHTLDAILEREKNKQSIIFPAPSISLLPPHVEKALEVAKEIGKLLTEDMTDSLEPDLRKAKGGIMSKEEEIESKFKSALEDAKKVLEPIIPTGNRLYVFKYKEISIYVTLKVDENGRWIPSYVHENLPPNWHVVLCNAGIAFGRIPELDLDRAIYHQNRVTRLFWHEAEVFELSNNEPVELEVPPTPELTPESELTDYLVYDYLAKNTFAALSGQEEIRQLWSLDRRLNNLREAGQESDEAEEQETDVLETGAEQPGSAQQEAEEVPSEEEPPAEDDLDEEITEVSKLNQKPSGEKVPYEDIFMVKNFDEYWEALLKEAAFWGISPDKLPKKEVVFAYVNRPPEADSHGTMDARAFACIVKRLLNDAIELLIRNIDQYYVDPDDPLTKGEIKHVRGLVLYVMSGLNCQSAETSSVSYKGEEKTPTGVLRVRKKIKAEAFMFLYEEFTRRLRASEELAPLFRTMFGYIIAAVDGTDINLLRNSLDEETLCKGGKGKKSYNQIHLNCIYDCLNSIYLTAIFRGRKKTGGGERIALYEMMESLDSELREQVLLTADRGYESHEALARLCLSGIRFVLRLKSTTSNGILQSLPGIKNLGETFQVWVKYRLSRKAVKNDGESPFTLVRRGLNFLGNEPLEMKLRIMQFRLPSGELETLVTNVPMWELSPYHLYCIYGIRWKVESSYRMLKYQTSVKQQHSKKPQYVRQELWGKLVMFNFASFIMSHTSVPETKRKHPRTYEYVVKRSRGIVLCRDFMAGAINLEVFSNKLTQRLQPIRPGRSFPRKVRPQSVQSSQTMGIGM